MKKTFLILSLFLMIFSVSGCQKRYAYASFREELGFWIGKRSEDLFARWGFPYSTQDIDPNTIAVTYYRTEKRPAYYSFTPYIETIQDKTIEVAEKMGYNADKKAPPSYYCRVTFIIYKNLVSKYTFDGEDCY